MDQWNPLWFPQHYRDPNKSTLLTPDGKNFKNLKAKITKRSLTRNPLGRLSSKLIKLKTDRRAWVFWPHPHLGT